VQEGLARALEAQVSAAGLVRNLRGVADQAITELRKVMTNLRPSQLDDLGLVPTLRWYLREYTERHPELRVELEAGSLSRRLPSNAETVLFRVTQEALSNVRNHAQAISVEVVLNGLLPEHVSMLVRDNGNGRAPGLEPLLNGRFCMGLVLMRERVERAGGTLQVQFEREIGTTVRVLLPRSPR
jgi:signal transduction histidine kinase